MLRNNISWIESDGIWRAWQGEFELTCEPIEEENITFWEIRIPAMHHSWHGDERTLEDAKESATKKLSEIIGIV